MRLSTLLPLMGLLAIGYAKKCPRQRTSPGKEILCYTSSNDVEELLEGICKCTTLVHQGYHLHDLSTSGVEELQKNLKEANPALQIVISVTDPQGTLRTSATTRQEASGRLANVLSQVDGIELDMSAGSKERLTHFLKGLKDEMIRKSNEKRIILALPTKVEDLAKQYDLKSLAKYVDLFTLSTDYLVDEKESFKTFHPSRLMGIFDMLNTDSLVDLVSGMGVPKNKLLVSLPAGAYKFTLKNENETMPGSSASEEVPSVISQKELCDLMSAGEWTVERDSDLTAPYAFKDSTWIAYEDKSSVGIKGKYVLLRELAGLGIHDIENDSKNDCGKTVIYEVYRSFTEMKRKTRGAVLASLENDLHHQNLPQSRNVRSSEFRIVRVVDTAGAIHAIRENMQTEFTCTRQGYFVHPKSCNRFYRCVKFNQGIDDYSVFEFDCPAGLAFDERTEVCVWPGSITEGSPCPGSSEIAPVPRARFQCPEHDGYYADPQNCRWFFACFHLGEPEPTAYEFRCPFGLVFDERKLICDWPWLVPNCGSPGYSRTEYGSSGYAVNLHGPGSVQGSVAGSLGFGDYVNGGLSGHYGGGADNSPYPGSKPSESRQSETEFGKYSGIGINGANYAGQGAGIQGRRYYGQGLQQSGVAGSGQFGAGSGAAINAGSGEFGSKFFGSGGNQASVSGQIGVGGSGLVVGGIGDSNSGAGVREYSGSETGGLSNSGLGVTNAVYFGSDASGSKYSNRGGDSAHSIGGFDASKFGSNQQSSSGSGTGSEYNSGHAVSTNEYNGLGKTAIVLQNQGQDSAIYQTGATGSGGITGSSVAGNSGFNGFGNTATKYEASVGTSQGFGKDGLTVSFNTGASQGGSYSLDSSGDNSGSSYSGRGNGAFTASGEGISDSQDVVSNGYNSGTTGNVYFNRGNSAYTASNEGTSDSQDVINDKFNSGLGVLTGTTGNVYSGSAGTNGDYNTFAQNTYNSLNQGQDSFGIKSPGTASPGVLVQTVTPGYSVVTSGVSQDHANDGVSVTGSGYSSVNTGNGNLVIDHGSDYNHGFVSVTPSPASGISLVNAGAGNEGGSYVVTGSSGTISDIGKGGISTGTTTYHGNFGPSVIATQSGNAGVSSEDGIRNGYTGFSGNEFGSKITQAGNGALVSNEDGGYKTTEYEGNGGRGTITFNNGYSSSKYTESDVRKGTNAFGSRDRTKGTYNAGSTTYNGQGFTKTGPTKTGFTTAQIGGTGSYVTSGGYNSNPTPTPGSNLFLEHSTADFSIGNDVNNLAQVTPTSAQDVSYVDTSKINLGHTSSGYQYKKPTVPFVTGSITASTPSPLSVTYQESVAPLTVTTPSPFLNVQVYNTPSVVTSAPITAAPAVVNTYSTLSSGYQYRKPTVYQRPAINTQKQYTLTPTYSPIGYVTGTAEVYKNTLFEAAKQPIAVSTVAPVFDNGYKTVISSTASPIADTTGQYFYKDSRFNTDSVFTNDQNSGQLDISYQQPEFNFQKEYVGSKPAQPLVYQTSGGTVQQTTNYQRPINNQIKLTVTPTSEPVAFVTGPAELYKNTLLGAAKRPITVSTVAPVFDNGYKTVISSTSSPIADTTGQYFYKDSRFNTDSVSNTGSTSGHLDVKYQQNEYLSSTTASDNNSKQGYVYTKPTIKFVTPSAAVPVYNTENGGASTKLNYNRGGIRFTPQVDYVDYNGNSGFGVKGFGNTVASKTYVSTTPASIIKTNSNYGGYNFGNRGSTYVSDGDSSSSFRPGNVYTSSTPSYEIPTVQSVTKEGGYGSYNSVNGESTYVDGDSSSSFRPGKVFVSSTPAYEISSVKSTIQKGEYGGYNYGNRDSTFVDGDSPSSFRPGKVFVSSTPAYEISSVKSTIQKGGYGGSNYGNRGSTYVDGGSSSSFRQGNVYTSSTPLYEVSTLKSSTGKGKGKVIVKLSDLHPLLLGKLGAQCTCRSDPFETLRGPGAKLIKSSRGDIDLKQYDESEIYVDLETDREPSQSAAVYRTPYGSPTSSPPAYSSSLRTPVTAVFGLSTPAPKVFRSRGKPSTAYLPVSSSPSPRVNPLEKGDYESSDTLDPQFVNLPAGFIREDVPVGRSSGIRNKAGKSLGTTGTGGNAITGAGAAFDRYGPGGLRGVDETLQGGADCARPGLFRHPKLCNKFYACHWDEWKQKYTLHVFNCPVHLSFDGNAGACNWPSKGPACQDDNLLV